MHHCEGIISLLKYYNLLSNRQHSQIIYSFFFIEIVPNNYDICENY